LFFAKHPAIQSIAGISVTGILSIVIVSFIIQPLLFRFFITARVEKGKPPMTILGILISIIGYTIFITGSLLSVVIGLVIRILPFYSKEWKKRAVHRVLSKFSGAQLDILFNTTKRYYNIEKLDYEQPSIIVSNHTSFFDILTLLRFNPKTVMMVNNWVYNSPLFGSIIRFADFIPTSESLDENVEKVRGLVKKGYSVAIFPEGSRSPDGKMRRFHKGAFYIAEKLNLDITPVLLHGFAYTTPKHDYFLKDSYISTEILDRIKPDDDNFGIGYKERSKKITAFYKREHKRFSYECESEDYMFYPLLFSYKYKGPILEWYFRIKWRFEKKHYENYNQLIGLGSKKIYDLGCGYGFLSYYLKLRVNEREVIGVDYDDEKILIAKHSHLKRPGIEFYVNDLVKTEIDSADVIILADVLHYLDENAQLALLNRCYKGLNKTGLLLIRDGVADNAQGHEWTKKSERWSTRWLKFNKTKGDLHFFTSEFIQDWANEKGMQIKSERHSKNSSNMLFVLRNQ
jgi:1-acyl-sn-glycerol-3-phosphate acyltransferase